jgi:hypothetical protein
MANQRYAVVKNGVVENVVMFDPEPKANWIQSDTASIGDLWNGQSFTRPAVPQSVQAAPSLDKRILQALIEKGVITEADIENLGG